MHGVALMCLDSSFFDLFVTDLPSLFEDLVVLENFVTLCKHLLLLYYSLLHVGSDDCKTMAVCHPKPISNLESLRGPFWVLCFSRSIPLHWAAWSLNTLSLTTSMLMTASCMFPLHQGTLQQHWMVYSHVWPLSSHGCRPINWNWTHMKLNSSLLGTNDSGKIPLYVSDWASRCQN